jgi:cyclopropane fatty-acyl-phospholipid synthase-like methyltransferase
MKSRGFRVIGLERSPGLAEIARRKAGCRVIRADFEQFDFSTLSVDAILLVGALVHIPHPGVMATLARILSALKDRGLAILTIKEGTGKRTDASGRTFYLWQHEDMARALMENGITVHHFVKQESAMGTGEAWLTYIVEPE